jgi:hypothetical protein
LGVAEISESHFEESEFFQLEGLLCHENIINNVAYIQDMEKIQRNILKLKQKIKNKHNRIFFNIIRIVTFTRTYSGVRGATYVM